MAGHRDQVDEVWAEAVARLDEADVRRLLVEAAGRNPDVGRAVRLAAAGSAQRVGVLKVEVDRVLRTRRYLGYWESSAWAVEAAPVVDALAVAVAAEPRRDLIALLERAIGHVVKVILRADDSDGMIGDLVRRLLDLHEQACDSGTSEPKALARWLIRFNFGDQDFFVTDPVRYAAALGDEGMAVFRRAVVERASGSSSFAARYALERLAVLDGDVEQIVDLLGGDLATPHQFIQVAAAMRELGRDDDALAWARRGIDTTSGWQVGTLFDLSAELLTEREDPDGVVALRREQHQRMPSSSSYAALRAAAEAVGQWPAEVGEAREVLARRDRGGLVDALLTDGDIDAAWEAATVDPGWDAGERRWQRLAKAREHTDPAAACAVYLRLADAALVTAGRAQYRRAAQLLRAARRTASAAGLTDEFQSHVLALREQHRRRPTLIAILDDAGLA